MKARPIEFIRFAAVIAILLLAMDTAAVYAQVPQEGDTGMVLIKKIVFSGNTVVDTATLQKVVEPFLERELTLQEMSELADLITMKYQESGYILARAYLPEQEIKDGVLKISIAEGKIGQIKVTGKTHYQDRVIKRYFGQQEEHGIVKESLLQKGLLLTKEMPEIETEVVLKGGEKPGTVDVILDTKDKSALTFSAHMGVDYNNFGSETVSVDRFGASIDILDHNWGTQLKLRGVTGKNLSDSGLGIADLSIPVNSYGTRIGLSYLDGAYAVGQELTDLGLTGRTVIFGANISHPFVKEKNSEFKTTLAYENKQTKNQIFEETQSTDVLNTYTVGLDFNNLDRYLGKNILNFQYVHGRLDNNEKYTPSRLNADYYFDRLKLNATRIQRIFGNTNLMVRGSGQLSHYRLLPIEQFVIGGYGTIRGYEPATYLGDSGYYVSTELMFAPPFIGDKTLFGQRVAQLLQFAFFYDHGGAFTTKTQSDEIGSEFLSGYGGGFRLYYKDIFTFKYDIGIPADREEGKDYFINYFMFSLNLF
ncbi:MAG: POTRA domain-containing protein [Thermodesulfobacteriota bacterium]